MVDDVEDFHVATYGDANISWVGIASDSGPQHAVESGWWYVTFEMHAHVA